MRNDEPVLMLPAPTSVYYGALEMMQGLEMPGKTAKEITCLGDERLQRCLIVDARSSLRLRLVAVCCMLAIVNSSTASATTVNDPTAPPPEWLALQPAIPGKLVPVPEAVMEVQVLIIGRARNLAVIDGQIVKVGDEHRGSKVLAVRADQIVKEDAAKSLLVTPAVVKKKPVLTYSQKKDVLVAPISDEATKATGTKQ